MATDWTPDPESLLRHLEAGLGPLDESASVSEATLRVADDRATFSVLAFCSSTAFATFGLSRHLLGDDPVVQELTVAVKDRDFAVNLLSTIGQHLLEHHRPLAAGERHRLPGWQEASWHEPSAIAGVMAVPDPLVVRLDAAPDVEFIRLLPITDSEATYARERGWRELVEKLGADGLDVTDLYRVSFA